MPKPMRRKGSSVTVDFSGVESGGGRAVPDGNYTVRVKEITEEESRDGNPYLKWIWTVTEGPCKGANIYDNTSLQPQALWRLKTLLECLGQEVPDSSLDLNLGDLVGSETDAEITNETYEGKQKPRITGFLGEGGAASSTKTTPSKAKKNEEESEEEDSDEEEEEEKPSKKKTKSAKFKVGQKVKFDDDDGKTQRGTITSIDGDESTVDVKGEEWTIDLAELEAA